ncbi:cytochrome b5 protein [Rutstroemia sp. NJR-2017a BVV2]|nr:cytochrome b5 protein [Rutstroemia sp. NJR-2017a BVV2]
MQWYLLYFLPPAPFSCSVRVNSFAGVDSDKCYVAIKGKVYDVTGNKAYLPGGSYHSESPYTALGLPCSRSLTMQRFSMANALPAVFAGHDASRALAKTSTSADDVSPDWYDLPEKEKGVLNDWNTFFSKRYNVVGVVQGAQNLEKE